MSKLELLAREAADLDRPRGERAHVSVALSPSGKSTVTVYVYNQFAFHHCDRDDEGQVATLDAGYGPFARIEESGDDLDMLVDLVMRRVQDAVADTPAEQVPA